MCYCINVCMCVSFYRDLYIGRGPVDQCVHVLLNKYVLHQGKFDGMYVTLVMIYIIKMYTAYYTSLYCFIGNDETTILTLRYPGNKVAILTSSTKLWLENRVFIHGPGGAIEVR